MDAELKKILCHVESIDAGIKELNKTLTEVLLKLLKQHDNSGLTTSKTHSSNGVERSLITLAELSQITGIPKKTLHNWTAPNSRKNPLGFSPIRSGRKKYFRREDVKKYIM